MTWNKTHLSSHVATKFTSTSTAPHIIHNRLSDNLMCVLDVVMLENLMKLLQFVRFCFPWVACWWFFFLWWNTHTHPFYGWASWYGSCYLHTYTNAVPEAEEVTCHRNIMKIHLERVIREQFNYVFFFFSYAFIVLRNPCAVTDEILDMGGRKYLIFMRTSDFWQLKFHLISFLENFTRTICFRQWYDD